MQNGNNWTISKNKQTKGKERNESKVAGHIRNWASIPLGDWPLRPNNGGNERLRERVYIFIYKRKTERMKEDRILTREKGKEYCDGAICTFKRSFSLLPPQESHFSACQNENARISKSRHFLARWSDSF